MAMQNDIWAKQAIRNVVVIFIEPKNRFSQKREREKIVFQWMVPWWNGMFIKFHTHRNSLDAQNSIIYQNTIVSQGKYVTWYLVPGLNVSNKTSKWQ